MKYAQVVRDRTFSLVSPPANDNSVSALYSKYLPMVPFTNVPRGSLLSIIISGLRAAGAAGKRGKQSFV